MAKELVLSLHGIGNPHDGVGTEESFFWITRQTFATLLENVVVARATAEIPIVITFDDGNASDATVALPELAKRGLKAIFFVCAGRIGAPRYLDRVALSDLLAAGMEVGTHGMHHRDWRKLSDGELNAELRVARRCIEDVCGRSVVKAAIPFGSYDRPLLARLRSEDFECVYTSDRGLARSKAWLKARNTIDNTWRHADIERILTSNYKTPLAARLRRKAIIFYKRLR